MWKKIDKPKTMQVTKSLVKEFCEMERLDRDRGIKERRMMIYRRILAAGEFRPVTWASAHCVETGATYRVNGAHTSLLLSGFDVLPEFFVTVERYECQTLEDVAKLWSTFDSALGSRNSNEIILSFAGTVKEFANLKKKTFPLAVAAAAYLEWGDSIYDHPPPDRAELLLDNVEATVWMDSLLWPSDQDQKRASHIRRHAVTTAMLGSFRKSRRDADAFWKEVRDETNPDAECASRKLARFLSRTNVRTKGIGSSDRPTVSFREMYVKCIRGWNSWRDGSETILKYFPTSKIPSFK